MSTTPLEENVPIIAEIGQNFCGDKKLALKLIDLAKENGADACKFQLFDGRLLYGSHTDMELTKDTALAFFQHGQRVGIDVFFSVFDPQRVQWCEEMGVNTYKVASRWGTNKSLVEAILKTGKPIIQSMSPSVSHYYIPDAQYLYCSSLYPTNQPMPIDALDFSWWSGISDHTFGLGVCKKAILGGARIIEKHFAIDHNQGIDAPWSMTPSELLELRRFDDEMGECV